MTLLKDLTGLSYGRLTVIKRVEDKITPKGQHHRMWLCQCNCGNYKTVSGNNLKNGSVKSCGCFRSQASSQRQKKYNKYNLSGEYGIGYTSNTNRPFYFDLEDYDKIKDYCWMEHRGYIEARAKIGNGNVYIHNIIMPHDDYIDHIVTENKFDNRKCNLRKANILDNACNRKTPTNNTSGVKGVCYDKSSNRWMASLTRNKHRITKSFKNMEDAIKYRLYLEEKYQKEFSYNTSQKIGERNGIKCC